MKVSLLTGGGTPHYVLGLLSGLVAKGIHVDFIGNDEMMNDGRIVGNNCVNFYNLRGNQNPNAPIGEKIYRVLKYYLKLMKYAAKTDSKLFHIQWLNKFIYFDRTILNCYYKIMGKKLVFTAHNINPGTRDENDSLVNKVTLKLMYEIVDHIIVHTNKMKHQLIEGFKIRENKITVIPHGIINIVPTTDMTRMQARNKLDLGENEKILMFFGNIAPYKGLDNLIEALTYLRDYHDLKLIIAGQIKKDCQPYWEMINEKIKEHNLEGHIFKKIEFILDEEIELYFKAADVLVLPYKDIFQTGVLFLAYNFGLPVIATDVGSLREEIIEGEIGFICEPRNPEDLAEKIGQYFHSDLYRNLESGRQRISNYAKDKYSWEKIGEKTFEIYEHLL